MCLQVWNLKPHVLAAVDPLLARLELEDKPTIGFHVRGGDKLDEDKKGCVLSSVTASFWLSPTDGVWTALAPWRAFLPLSLKSA